MPDEREEALEEQQEPPLIALVGPTAVGKTAVGIALAERIDGEIVSADAVAVYKKLDIGAAKPTREEQAQVPFHLLDVAAPDEDFTLADFERLADEAITKIRNREHVPLVVGGTGLYVRSVTATLTVPNVPPQPAFRAALWAEVEEKGAPALHARLAESDPAAAAKILLNDAKRIIRALEVLEMTGQPMSSFHTPEGVRGVPRPNTTVLGLRMERAVLYRRIEARVDAMMAAGFVEEVQSLLAAGYSPEAKAMQSLGYRHIAQYLSGQSTLDMAIEELKRDTRRYAKRQISWFNADPQVVWLDLDAEPKADTVADQALAALKARSVKVNTK
jgi:tRNA dimethylallyltransferase